MKVFVIRDMKAGLYLQPFFERNAVQALRGFEQVANDGENMISRYPNDFRLYEVGEFNMDTGRILPHDELIDLGPAADVKRKPEKTLFTDANA